MESIKVILENSFLCVIVLYKTELKDCICYNTLKEYCKNNAIEPTILIYNNSTETKAPISNDYIVYNSNTNCMLTGAYNYALTLAKEQNKEWLLLLDQDTKINDDYFISLASVFKHRTDKNIVAFVPKLSCKGVLLSPVQNRSEQNVWWFQKTITQAGCYKKYITAFNSGTVLNVDFMASIGGFSEKYPLDRLDYWYFLQIYKAKKSICILDVELEHDLSILDYEKNINIRRYQSILQAELNFAKETGVMSLVLYKLLLFFRIFKQLICFKDKKYAYNTFLQLWK